MFVDYNEWAALWGVYPKTDQSHGFPNPLSYEMYRDLQENTINSDVKSINNSLLLGLVRYVDFLVSRRLYYSCLLQLHASILLDVRRFENRV